MIHDFIHRLAGRQTGFREPLLGMGAPCPTAVEHLDIKKWLGLQDTDTDAHVVAFLTAAAAFPEDSGVTGLHIRPWDLPAPAVEIVGASLAGTPASPVVAAYAPAAWPFPTSFTLRYKSPSEADLTHKDGGETMRATSYTVASDVFLAPSWPAWLGLTANLLLGSAWQPGARCDINLPPRSYPFLALRDAMHTYQPLVRLLDSKGLAAAFFETPNPVRAAAVVVRALTQ